MSMQLSTGQELSLPDCAKVKPGAPQGKRKRDTDGGSAGQHEYKRAARSRGASGEHLGVKRGASMRCSAQLTSKSSTMA